MRESHARCVRLGRSAESSKVYITTRLPSHPSKEGLNVIVKFELFELYYKKK